MLNRCTINGKPQTPKCQICGKPATANSAPQAAPTAAQTRECAERAGRIARMLERAAQMPDERSARAILPAASALCSELQKALGARPDGMAEHMHALTDTVQVLRLCAKRLQDTDADTACMLEAEARGLTQTVRRMWEAIEGGAQ